MPFIPPPSNIKTSNDEDLYVSKTGDSVIDGNLILGFVNTSAIVNRNQVFSSNNPTVIPEIAQVLTFSPPIPANSALPIGVYNIIGKFDTVGTSSTESIGINGLFYNNGTDWIGCANGPLGLILVTIVYNSSTNVFGYFVNLPPGPGPTIANLNVNLVYSGSVVGITNM
jgi:hypothetical protein